MKIEYELLNQGHTVVIRGIAYDFPDLLMADAFIEAVETGAVPSNAATLLLNRAYFPRPPDH